MLKYVLFSAPTIHSIPSLTNFRFSKFFVFAGILSFSFCAGRDPTYIVINALHHLPSVASIVALLLILVDVGESDVFLIC